MQSNNMGKYNQRKQLNVNKGKVIWCECVLSSQNSKPNLFVFFFKHIFRSFTLYLVFSLDSLFWIFVTRNMNKPYYCVSFITCYGPQYEISMRSFRNTYHYFIICSLSFRYIRMLIFFKKSQLYLVI
jgi:hypothetical protein